MGYDLGHWLWFFLVGGGTGLMAGLIARERGLGTTADIIIGCVGAILGGWISGMMRIYSSLDIFIISFIGAAVLVSLTRLIKRAVKNPRRIK